MRRTHRARGDPHRAEHAHRVFLERLRRGGARAYALGGDVVHAADKVQHEVADGVVEERVDGEVALVRVGVAPLYVLSPPCK